MSAKSSLASSLQACRCVGVRMGGQAHRQGWASVPGGGVHGGSGQLWVPCRCCGSPPPAAAAAAPCRLTLQAVLTSCQARGCKNPGWLRGPGCAAWSVMGGKEGRGQVCLLEAYRPAKCTGKCCCISGEYLLKEEASGLGGRHRHALQQRYRGRRHSGGRVVQACGTRGTAAGAVQAHVAPLQLPL